MNDAAKRQVTSAGVARGAERHRSIAELTKRQVASPTFDRCGDALRKQQPPGDDVAIPGIDDGVDVLLEKIAVDV